MKLSMWDLFGMLPYENMMPMISTGRPTIERARFLAPSYLDERTVYSGWANDYFEAEEDDSLIVHREDMILVRGVSAENVFNEISSILDRYEIWETALANAVDADNGLQRMVDASKDILGAPCFIYAPDGRVFAISTGYPPEIHWHWAEIIENEGVSSERMRELRDSINLPEVWKDTFPKRRSSHICANEYLHCSLYPNGYMAGHFVMFGFLGPFRRGIERIANVLVDYMTRCMERHYPDYSPLSQFTESLDHLLAQDSFEEAEIELLMRALRWKLDDPFRIYVFLERHETSSVLLSHLRNIIEQRYPSTVSLVFEGEVVVLENESLACYGKNVEAGVESLAKDDFCCGVSDTFRDISRCRGFFEQARMEALRCRQEGGLVSRATHHKYERIVELIGRSAHVWTYADQCAYELLCFDRDNDTAYYETLRAYVLSGFHLSDAARFLGIHRNSLMYRLDRMREIVDMAHIDEAAATHDAAMIELLVMSFAIIDSCYR